SATTTGWSFRPSRGGENHSTTPSDTPVPPGIGAPAPPCRGESPMTIAFRRTADTVRGAGAEAAALASHLLRYPTGIPPERHPRPCPPHPVPAPAHPGPVLLLHGFIDNRAVFTPLR